MKKFFLPVRVQLPQCPIYLLLNMSVIEGSVLNMGVTTSGTPPFLTPADMK